MKTRLLGVVGSLQRNSLTRHAVEYALRQARDIGAETRLVDLLESPLPVFNPEQRDGPEYRKVAEDVVWASAYLLGSPDYHGSMSGATKNFLDYFWKELAGKLFGYVCASHEKGLTVMDHMRTSVRQCYGWSLPYGACVTDGDLDKKTGKVLNSKVGQRLDLMAYDLVTYGSLLRARFEGDVASPNPKAGFAAYYRPSKEGE